jgi:hypothetical protein
MAGIEVLARYQQHLADQQRSDENRQAQEILAHEASVSMVVEDEALLASLAARRFAERSATVPSTFEDATNVNCSSIVASPPFPIGWPRTQETGVAPIIVETGASPNLAFLALPGATIMKTFTQLAVPDTGRISLGVALGKLQLSATTQTVHPATEVGPGPLAQVVEMTNARAGIGYVTAAPGAPLPVHTPLRVTAELTIGSGPRPFHLLVRPDPEPPRAGGVTANGVVHVVVEGSEGDTSDTAGKFLEHHMLGTVDWLAVPPTRNLSVAGNLLLRPGTRWVYIGIEVLVEVQRYWLFQEPEERLEDRTGFAGIDLRTPALGLPPVHALLQASGPVTLRRLRLSFCPPQVSELP